MTFAPGMRPVFVAGIGLHRYQKPSDVTYVELGLTAVRAALEDAGLEWSQVDSAYVGTAMLGMAPGRAMLRYLGATGLSIAQVENASASGSTAFRQACIEVACGMSDVALAVGVDKAGRANMAPSKAGIGSLAGYAMPPVATFALMASSYMARHHVTPEQIAAVAVKNHNNAARNPFAQFQKERSLEDVLGESPVAGIFTRLQCCPFGDGAAAAIVASEDAIERLGVQVAPVRVTASASSSETVVAPEQNVSTEVTRAAARHAFRQAGIGPTQLDVVELHDAFSIEELVYTEALGLCPEGGGARYLESGATRIGGECAVSASGGLLGMGHPFGPTGVGQVVEITRQLRGDAGNRQHAGAKRGLAHMVGIGQVCVVHILERV